MFNASDIRSRATQQPFQPFRIETSSGQTYDVHHPDMVLVGKREVVVGIPDDDSSYHERIARVAIMHITELRDLPSQKAVSDNGQ